MEDLFAYHAEYLPVLDRTYVALLRGAFQLDQLTGFILPSIIGIMGRKPDKQPV
jgi:hypothetical protein